MKLSCSTITAGLVLLVIAMILSLKRAARYTEAFASIGNPYNQPGQYPLQSFFFRLGF